MNKKLLIGLLFTALANAASTYTTNYNLEKPADGDTNWGEAIRDGLDTIDTQMKLSYDTANDHINDSSAAHAASAISNTVSGFAVCTTQTTVQLQLACLDDAINDLAGGGAVDLTSNQTITGTKTFSTTPVFSALGTGVIHSDATGVLSSSTVVNADVASGAAIDFSKLATLTSGNILVGNGSNVAASVAVSGDIGLSNAGVASISSGVVVDDDVNASAAIARSKLASGTADHVLINNGSGVMSSEASLAITRGGTGQTTASAGFDALSPVTTKGDVIVRNSSTNTRLAVGSDGQVLTADSAQSTGVKWSTPAGAPDASYELTNLTLTGAVAANALTVAVKTKAGTDATGGDPIKIGFRNSTAATGTYSQVTLSSALSVVVSSGSTLGHTSGANHFVYVYLINNAGTPELAVSSSLFDDGSILSTTAEGGAGSADSNTAIYSTTARSNVAARLVGRILSNQATAGTWASAVSEISILPFAQAKITSSSSVQQRVEAASIVPASGASCTISLNPGTFVASTTPNAAGDCTITFTTAFTSTPICTASSTGFGGAFDRYTYTAWAVSASTTSVRVRTTLFDADSAFGSTNPSAATEAINIICIGNK